MGVSGSLLLLAKGSHDILDPLLHPLLHVSLPFTDVGVLVRQQYATVTVTQGLAKVRVDTRSFWRLALDTILLVKAIVLAMSGNGKMVST